MRTVSLTVSMTEARSRFDELIQRASHGDAIVITRYGKEVAMMVSKEAAAEIYPDHRQGASRG
jgi:prevent-host-death family protein